MPKTEAELMQQFEELVADMRELANGLLKPKNPANLKYIENRFFHLTRIVRQNPEQAEAVLLCADAMWHLLYETAHGGVGVQHRRDAITKITKEEVLKEWNALHKENPDILKTTAVKDIAKKLDRPTRKPDRPCSERTVWDRLKELGI